MLYIYPDGRQEEHADSKMSVRELEKLFGRAFHLSYAYSVPCINNAGESYETDYWACAVETHGMEIQDCPPFNQPVKDAFNLDRYGLVIVAPSNCF